MRPIHIPTAITLVAILVGCSAPNPIGSTANPAVAPGAERAKSDTGPQIATYKLIHDFDPPNGAGPQSPLIVNSAGIVGLTANNATCMNCGLLFSMTPAGSEHVVATMPSIVSGGPVELNGTYYGAMIALHGSTGAIFAVSASGNYRTLYTFQGGSDGADPLGPLTVSEGALYGVTLRFGSACHCGTVFELSTSGQERVLHRFGGTNDGSVPNAPLVYLHGSLWGTTEYGGAKGYGTIFAVDSAGNYRVEYTFQGGADGYMPQGGLVDVAGQLYGTTAYGGGGCNCGTIFSFTTSGQKKTLYEFKGTPDGRMPVGSMVFFNQKLYGTTQEGGAAVDGISPSGTLFASTLSGGETVLHTFGAENDGSDPSGNLVLYNSTLYGVTPQGGGGAGTVFSYTP